MTSADESAERLPPPPASTDLTVIIGTTDPDLLIDRITSQAGAFVGQPLKALIAQAPGTRRLVVVPLTPASLAFALLPEGPLPVASSAIVAWSRLSLRESEIVTRLLAGDRVPAIAKALFITQSTVRNHLSSVFRKMNVASQQELLELLRQNDGPSGL
jgi:DNA-binding CsgD family transcriptional regulator